ncbi:hypothetical protein GBA52_003103 [Prunus armeniaca]|nr:hypothetical protein GBA52_003103 [Prunus armeniaca]
MKMETSATHELYEHPTHCNINETKQTFTNDLMKLVFTIIPAGAFPKTSHLLEKSISNVSWLLASPRPPTTATTSTLFSL